MKKNNILKVVLISLGVAVLLSWLFNTTTFQVELVEDGPNQVGLFGLFSDMTSVASYFAHVLLYLFAVGAFYAVLHSIPGYRNLLDKIVKSFKGKEWLFIVISIALVAVMTAMARMGIAVVFVFPLIAAIILLMGYDKITVALVTAGAVAVGLMGTVFSMPILETQSDVPHQLMSTSILKDVLNNLEVAKGVDVAGPVAEWGVKLAILAIGIAILAFNTIKHAKKVRDTKNIEASSLVPEATATKKKESWLPLAIIFDLTLLVMILSFMSWSNVFEKTWFVDITESVMSLKVGEFPIFQKILGFVPAFGNWTLNELVVLLFVSALVIAFIYRVKTSDFIENIVAGVKAALKPALVVLLIYVVMVIALDSNYILTIVKPILTLSKGFNVATMSIAAFLTSFLGVEMFFASPVVLDYAVSLTDGTNLPLIAIIWQSMNGLAMLVAPTSVVLMGTLAYLKVPYGSWLKASWKVLVEILVALLIIFLLMLML